MLRTAVPVTEGQCECLGLQGYEAMVLNWFSVHAANPRRWLNCQYKYI